jgi:hypothetical protein
MFQPPQTKLETYEIKPATFQQKQDFEAILCKHQYLLQDKALTTMIPECPAM